MAWPGSSANGDPRGRSEERPDRPACPLECRRTSAKRTRFAHLSFDAHDPERKLPSSDWLIIISLSGVQGWIISSTSHWLIGADVAGAVGIVSASATLTYAEKSGECVPRG